MSGPKRSPYGDAGQGARGVSYAADPRESRIQEAGEAAIAHHFACPPGASLRFALVPDAINYLCEECGARVSVGADGLPAGAPASTAAPDEMTREAIQAERDRRQAVGERFGYSALANHFLSTSSTIRRRLGKIK
ncbi:MAG: hypothetical protein AABZ33_07675 [Chloroflexota bacterium]